MRHLPRRKDSDVCRTANEHAVAAVISHCDYGGIGRGKSTTSAISDRSRTPLLVRCSCISSAVSLGAGGHLYGVESTPIQDFTYYRTFFLRDPDGHICAAATPPQFTVDEPRSELGRNLCLPDDLEPRRAELELQTALKPAPAAAQAIAAAVR